MALSACAVKTGPEGRELAAHGTAAFPVACYNLDLSRESVYWHWHEELEAVFVVNGSAALRTGGENHCLKEGQGIFINGGVVHEARAGEPGQSRLCSVVFHPRLIGGSLDSIFWQNYLRPLLEDGQVKAIVLDPEIPWQGQALAALQKAWRSCSGEELGYEFTVREELSRVICLLAGRRPPQTRLSAKELRDGERIKQMLRYMEEHFCEQLTMERVAASAAISPSECLRCFHSTIGITPIQYLKQYRIQRAAKLLAETSMKIVDVGTECGFQEMSYFARAFREIKGCTPSEFRKRAAAFRAEAQSQGFSEESGGREADREILPYADAE